MSLQWTQIKDTSTQSSAMTTNTLHSFLSPQSPSKCDVVLTAVLLRIQNFWDVTLLLSEWFHVILQNADTYCPSDIVSHTTTLESSNFLLVPSLPVPNNLERPTRSGHYFIYHWSAYSPLMRLKTWKECDMA